MFEMMWVIVSSPEWLFMMAVMTVLVIFSFIDKAGL